MCEPEPKQFQETMRAALGYSHLLKNNTGVTGIPQVKMSSVPHIGVDIVDGCYVISRQLCFFEGKLKHKKLLDCFIRVIQCIAF